MVLSLLASGGPNAAPPFFTLLTVVFMGIIAIALILAHFRQSLLAGYFICGVILANCGILDHIPNSDVSIQALSEVGIILLMFTLGLEFSIDELKHLRKTALGRRRHPDVHLAPPPSAWGSITPRAWI